MITIPQTVFGIMALMITTLAGVVTFLFKSYIAEKDKRFQDQKDNNSLYQQAMGEFSRTSELMFAKFNGEGKK